MSSSSLFLWGVHMRTLGSALRLVLGVTLLAACGDSTGSGGTGAGASSSNGGNGAGAGSEGGAGAGTNLGGGGSTSSTMTTGGGGSGGGTPGMCSVETTNITGPCDLYLQDCPSADDTCEVTDANLDTPEIEATTICITRNGLKDIGETCNTGDDCGKHLTCVGNKCTPFCCPDDPNGCAGGTCNVNVSMQNPDGSDSGFTFTGCAFSQACDLFTPSSCPPGENCYLGDPGMTACYSPTVPEGQEVGDGMPCDALNDCADSAICIQIGTDPFVCRFLCEINSSQPPGLGGCPGGQLCDTNSFDTGFAGVGLCHP